MTENKSYADRCLAEAIAAAVGVGHGVLLQACSLHQ